MNSKNNTLVSAKMLEEMRKAGVAKDYTEVPDALAGRAKEILSGRDIADLDEPTKKEMQHAGNNQREKELAKGLESKIVKAQIEARERMHR